MNKTNTLSIKYGVIFSLLYSVYRIALYHVSKPLFASMSLLILEQFILYPILIFILSYKIRQQDSEGWSFVNALKNIALLILTFNITSLLMLLYFQWLQEYSVILPYFIADINDWYARFDLAEEQKLEAIAKMDYKRSTLEKLTQHFSVFGIGKIVMLLIYSFLLKKHNRK